MMYTICILILIVISVFLISTNLHLYKKKAFWFWLLISCITGWLEFFFYLRHDSWVFDPNHIIGIYIYNVTIEDIIFCPCFSIIFWKLYFWTRRKFFQRVYNPDDKLLFAVAVFGVIIFNFNIGSLFGKYMALRMAISLIGLIYCWNYSSFRHSLVFMFVVFVIAAGWDIPFVNLEVWTYIKDFNDKSIVYDGMHIKIFKAVFPIEIWSYYITGASFSFWTMAFVDRYFSIQNNTVNKYLIRVK